MVLEKGKDRPRFGRPNRTEIVGLSKWALTVSVEIRFGPACVFGLGPKRKKILPILENINLLRWGSGSMIEGRGEDETGLTGEGEGEKMEERKK